MRRTLATVLLGLAVSGWGLIGCENTQSEPEPVTSQQQYTPPPQQQEQQPQQRQQAPQDGSFDPAR